jgi:hypothetical protein
MTSSVSLLLLLVVSAASKMTSSVKVTPSALLHMTTPTVSKAQ